VNGTGTSTLLDATVCLDEIGSRRIVVVISDQLGGNDLKAQAIVGACGTVCDPTKLT